MDGWWNDYVGIPYAERGRTREGADCWGLVRLVYGERFGIELPSFAEAYEDGRDPSARELIARHREGWVSTDCAEPGDVVVLRILGGLTHVGVIAAPGLFLHVRAGKTATIERLGSDLWRHRVEGYYRYEALRQAVAPLTVGGLPHPLRASRFDAHVPAGLSLGEIAQWIRTEAQVPDELSRSAIIMLNGEVIPVSKWDLMRPGPGDRVDYRGVAREDYWRTILNIGVLVGAALLAPFLAPYLSIFGITGAAATGLATAAITASGALLVNALFPVRPPQARKSQESVAANLLTGGQNAKNPFGAIPVVLGQYRFTPPLGAETYIESEGTESYMRALLVWGYGPLQVTDIRMGDTPIESLEEVEFETVNGDGNDDMPRFNSLYGQDVSQTVVNVKLSCFPVAVSGAVTRTANVLTVNTNVAHGFAVGDQVWVPLFGFVDVASVPLATRFTAASTGADTSNGSIQTVWGSAWTSRVLPSEADRITVTLHFPQGLRSIKIDGDTNVGDTYPAQFQGFFQVRQLDPGTLAPITAWGDIDKAFKAQTFNLPSAWFNIDADAELEKVYRWTRVSVDSYGRMILRHGAFTTNSAADPTGNLLLRLQKASFGLNATYTRLPDLGPGETELWQICIFGDAVFSTVDKRAGASFTITGCALSNVGRKFTVAAGSFARAESETIRWGDVGQRYNEKKDAFSANITFYVPKGRWEFRCRRSNASEYTDDTFGAFRYFWECYLVAVTGYSAARPVVQPAPLAMTAIRIRASNQINGNVEGFAGTVVSICKDYDAATTSWVDRPTRNPASLFRFILQHPGNAQAVLSSGINLTDLEAWHAYCKTNKFMFDGVVTEARSILDMLRDVAAAGRASPTIRDGKWTVIIDKPRSAYAQFFTPHNSWGFEGSRALVKLPHAFRVAFANADKGYQADERIVYNDGYSSANATLFEGLSLPGVTLTDAIFKHARFHLAQLKLRPERYKLSVDIENLVCTRGDLVKVTHDVPMWGLGSGRIKTMVSGTNLILGEAVPMAASTQYTIRIRLEDGSSITRTVDAKGAAGNYSDITLTGAVTAVQGQAGNLFMFGALTSESVDCVVEAIEPADNLSAQLTLVDYSPAVYDSDSEVIPAFDSQITKPPNLLRNIISQVPTITRFVSDESVMELLNNGAFAYHIRASYTNPVSLPPAVKFVEGQIYIPDATDDDWKTAIPVRLGKPVVFDDVIEGRTYKMRFRYVTGDGRIGKWTATQSHTVVGKRTVPIVVTGLAIDIDLDKVFLVWNANPELDIDGYEVRTADTGWGTSTGIAFKGKALTALVKPAAIGVAKTWFVRAFDVTKRYSSTSASVTLTVTGPAAPAAATQSISKPGINTITLVLDWNVPAAGTFAIGGYEVRLADTGWGTASGYSFRGAASKAVLTGVSNTVSTTFYIRSFDIRGNYSTASLAVVHNVSAPATMAAAAITVTRQVATLTMKVTGAPAQPSDFDCYEFRIGQVRAAATAGDDTPDAVVATAGDTFWADPDCTVVRSDTVNASVSIKDFATPRYSATGILYRVACRMRDKSGNYSPASALGSLNITSIS